jgi:hypothetical protein
MVQARPPLHNLIRFNRPKLTRLKGDSVAWKILQIEFYGTVKTPVVVGGITQSASATISARVISRVSSAGTAQRSTAIAIVQIESRLQVSGAATPTTATANLKNISRLTANGAALRATGNAALSKFRSLTTVTTAHPSTGSIALKSKSPLSVTGAARPTEGFATLKTINRLQCIAIAPRSTGLAVLRFRRGVTVPAQARPAAGTVVARLRSPLQNSSTSPRATTTALLNRTAPVQSNSIATVADSIWLLSPRKRLIVTGEAFAGTGQIELFAGSALTVEPIGRLFVAHPVVKFNCDIFATLLKAQVFQAKFMDSFLYIGKTQIVDFQVTPATAIATGTLQFMGKYSRTEPDSKALFLKQTGSGIEITDTAAGKGRITLSKIDTQGLKPGTRVLCDLQLINGGQEFVLADQEFSVRQPVNA